MQLQGEPRNRNKSWYASRYAEQQRTPSSRRLKDRPGRSRTKAQETNTPATNRRPSILSKIRSDPGPDERRRRPHIPSDHLQCPIKRGGYTRRPPAKRDRSAPTRTRFGTGARADRILLGAPLQARCAWTRPGALRVRTERLSAAPRCVSGDISPAVWRSKGEISRPRHFFPLPPETPGAQAGRALTRRRAP